MSDLDTNPEIQTEQTFKRVSLAKEIPIVTDKLLSDDWDDDLSTLEPITPEQWREHKRERNAITAVIIRKSFDRTLSLRSQRQPVGLLTQKYDDVMKRYYYPVKIKENMSEDIMNPIEGIIHDMGVTMEYDLANEIVRMKTLAPDEFDYRTYTRLRSLTQGYWRENKRMPQSKDWVVKFIAQGVETATDVMKKNMETIVLLYKKQFGIQPTPEQVANIARHSYSTIAKLAGSHINIILPILAELSNKLTEEGTNQGFKLDNFYFKTNNEGETGMYMNDKAWDALVEKYSTSNNLNSDTTGCPALAAMKTSVDGSNKTSNVVKDMWNWYTDLVESV